MKNKTDKQTLEESQKQGVTKHKLITEFTPFTGLRLRVPLQWVLIQLISLKRYKDGFGIKFSTVNRKLYKVFKTSRMEITFSLRKAKKAKV